MTVGRVAEGVAELVAKLMAGKVLVEVIVMLGGVVVG